MLAPVAGRSNFKRCNMVSVAIAGITLLASAVAAACGGGGSAIPATTGHPLPSPTMHSSPTPTATPTPTPTTAATSIPFSLVGSTEALPAVGSYAESITVPSSNQWWTNSTFSLTISTQALTGLPGLQSVGRHSMMKRSAAVHPFAIAPPGGTGILYFGLSSWAVTFASLPSLTINLPAPADPGLGYYLAEYDPTNPSAGWQTQGQLTASGTTLTASFTVDYIPNWSVTVQAHNSFGWGPSSSVVTLGGL